jgi:cytochrome P450
MSEASATRTGCPVLRFDHRAIQSGERFRVWDELRALGPIFWSDQYGGFWVVGGFEEVSAVLRDDATFSSAKNPDGTGGQSIPPFIWQRNVPGEYDGEEHVRLRSVLLPPLSPKLIEGRRPMVAALVSEIFDRLEGRATVDATREIAVPVPAHSMFTFMGLPRSDAEAIGLTVHEIMGAREGTARAAELAPALEAIKQRMLDEVAERRARPTGDIISLYANLTDENRKLGPDELLSVLVTGMLFGGLVTAAETLANGMVYLARHPDMRARLAAEPELIPNFVQDLVRWVTPASSVARTVTKTTVLGGQTLKPGERILCLLGSANHDPKAFEAPHLVNPGAWRNRHVGFGLGAHFCPGAPLARLEIEMALRELLRRAPAYTIDDLDQAAIGLADPAGGWRPLVLRPKG